MGGPHIPIHSSAYGALANARPRGNTYGVLASARRTACAKKGIVLYAPTAPLARRVRDNQAVGHSFTLITRGFHLHKGHLITYTRIPIFMCIVVHAHSIAHKLTFFAHTVRRALARTPLGVANVSEPSEAACYIVTKGVDLRRFSNKSLIDTAVLCVVYSLFFFSSSVNNSAVSPFSHK
jgi:hypothetical protein